MYVCVCARAFLCWPHKFGFKSLLGLEHMATIRPQLLVSHANHLATEYICIYACTYVCMYLIMNELYVCMYVCMFIISI